MTITTVMATVLHPYHLKIVVVVASGKQSAVNTGDNNGEQQEEVRVVEDFGTIVVFPLEDKHLLELESDPDVNLSVFDQYGTKAFKKNYGLVQGEEKNKVQHDTVWHT
jgi:hypothetical protein